MLRYLENLPPGQHFRLAGMPEITGKLIDCSECSATVELDGGIRNVEFENPDGSTRTFVAHRTRRTTWAPATVVEPIFNRDLENDDMSKKKASKPATKKAAAPKAPKAEKKPAATKATKKKPAVPAMPMNRAAANATTDYTYEQGRADAKAASQHEAKTKTDAPAKEKKTSAIDAAARLLQEHGEPMNCKAMIDGIVSKGWWSSPAGKTPWATLYSAIIREIAEKGDKARFKKTERGCFAFNG